MKLTKCYATGTCADCTKTIGGGHASFALVTPTGIELRAHARCIGQILAGYMDDAESMENDA